MPCVFFIFYNLQQMMSISEIWIISNKKQIIRITLLHHSELYQVPLH